MLDDVWDVAHPEAFANALGTRCRLLITTRDGTLITALGAQEHRVNLLSPEAALHLLANWSAHPLEALPPETRDVAAECGYLPFALALCGAMARDGTPWADLLAALRQADLSFLQQQFPNYPHPDVLKSLKVGVDALARTSPNWAKHYSELAVFPPARAVPEAAVLEMWLYTNGLNERSARRLLTTLERKALLRLEGQAPRRRVSLHDLQHAYLRAVVDDLVTLHNALLDAYAAKCSDGWTSGPNDGYFLQNLIYHLLATGDIEHVHRLLIGSSEWMEAKFRACAGHAGYLADVQLTIADIVDTSSAPGLLALLQLLMATQVAHAESGDYSDEDLKTMVMTNRLDEARTHACLRSDAEERFRGIMAIHEARRCSAHGDCLCLNLARRASDEMTNIPTRVSALRQLAKEWDSVGWRAEAISARRQAVQQARRIESPAKRAELLGDLSAELLAEGLTTEGSSSQREALQAARQIADPWTQAHSLSSLARAMSQTENDREVEQVFDEAITTALAIDVPANQSIVLLHISTDLAKTGRTIAALRTARGIAEYRRHAQALASIVGEMVKIKSRSFDEVIPIIDEGARVAHLEPDLEHRMEAIAPLVAVATRAGHFDLARRLAGTMTKASYQAKSLCEIATHLSSLTRDEEALALFDQAVASTRVGTTDEGVETLYFVGERMVDAGYPDRALKIAEALAQPLQRARILCRIAAALAGAGRCDEAVKTFGEARQHAAQIEHEVHRSKEDSDILATMAHVRLLPIEEALQAARDVKDRIDRSSAEQEIVVCLIESGHLERALRVARAIDDPDFKVGSLRQVCLALTKVGALSQAAFIVDEIQQVARSRAESAGEAEALQRMAVALARMERFSVACALAELITEDGVRRGHALQQIAVAQADAGLFEDAHATAHRIEYFWSRGGALREVAIKLAATGSDEDALSIAKEIEDFDHRLRCFLGMAKFFELEGRTSPSETAYGQAFATAWSRACAYDRGWSLAEVGLELTRAGRLDQARRAFDESQTAIRAIEHEWNRDVAFGHLARSTAAAGQHAEAFQVAHQIQNHAHRTKTLTEVVTSLAEAGHFTEALATSWSVLCLHEIAAACANAGHFPEAVEIAERIEDSWRRSIALSSVARSLCSAGDLCQARELILQITSPQWKAKALVRLAAAMARAGSAAQSEVVYMEACETAMSIDAAGSNRSDTLSELAAALTEAGYLERARQVAKSVEIPWSAKKALRRVARGFALSGCFEQAVQTLTMGDVNEYLLALAEWAPYIENIESGLIVEVLQQTTRIAGWTRPRWAIAHSILATPDG